MVVTNANKMWKTKEEKMENQELVIVKDSFLSKIAKAFKKIFSRDKDVELLLMKGMKITPLVQK